MGVESICRVLGVSASAYHRRRTGQRSDRSLEDERLLEVIRVTHRRNYEAYGYRRMGKALLRAGEDAPGRARLPMPFETEDRPPANGYADQRPAAFIAIPKRYDVLAEFELAPLPR